MTLKVLDCFSGIGGFALAESFFEGQFETKQFVEINPYCQQVLSKNFNVPIHDDIKTFTAKEGDYQLCTFGFPCQDISVAGRQSGIGEGTRSGLFYECIRILREVRPQFAIFENVRNLLSIEEGRVFQEVLFQIAQAGDYDIEWGVVSARSVGGCHLRERIFILAHTKHNGSSTPKRLRFNAKANASTQKGKNATVKPERSSQPRDSKAIQRTSETSTPNSLCKGLEGLRGEHQLQEGCGEEEARWRPQPYTLQPDWRRYEFKPMLDRRTDGVPSKLDAGYRNRKQRIQCLGNAVTPQQAAIPLGRVLDILNSSN